MPQLTDWACTSVPANAWCRRGIQNTSAAGLSVERPCNSTKCDRSMDPGEGRTKNTRGGASSEGCPDNQPHVACRGALDDPGWRAHTGLPPARRQKDRWASQPTEMDSCARRRQTGLLESSITSCAVCKFPAPRCIGPIIWGWGKGRSLREGVSAGLNLLHSSSAQDKPQSQGIN